MAQANSISEAHSLSVASYQAMPVHEDHIHREIKYFREFAAVYTDAIRSSDFKANIAPFPAAPDGGDPQRAREELPADSALAAPTR
jgi:hypothetical protein